MSYNGSGTFNINTAGQPVVTGTVISSTAFNALTADLATGLSTAITKDGQTTTTARITFAQGISSTLVTDATSATTGSIITAGGISCQKALWVGTTSRHVGATQFDAAITYGGVTLSNSVTGTGSMVLSASPTLTGTLTAATISASATATATAFIPSGSSVPTNGVYLPAANSLGFSTNSTERMRLDSSGQLIVGTTTPEGFVTFVKSSPTSGNGLVVSNGVDANVLTKIGSSISGIGSGTNTPFYFCTNNTERARFGTDGSFLVGTTTNGGWSANGTIVAQSSSAVALSGYGVNSTSTAVLGRVDNTSANLALFYYTTSTVGSITTNGTNTAYNTSSDARLKNNIADAGDAGAIIDALRVRQWDWKSNGLHEAFGFVAQEEHEVYAPAVVVGDDGDEIERQWSRDDSKLVPLLVKEIQSLRQRLAALEAN